MNSPVHRNEQTGNPTLDRIQGNVRDLIASVRTLAQDIRVLKNRTYVALGVDVTVAAGAYAKLIETTITTSLASGFLDVIVSTSGQELAAVGTKWFLVLVDGKAVKGAHTTSPAAGYAFSLAMFVRIPITAGKHTVTLQWKTDAGSGRINAKSIPEEHATMLVREAAS